MNKIKAENLAGKNDHFFDTEHLKSDLKGRSVRGGTVTVAAQGVRFFLQICSTAVLARLLTPQDYGLIAMVTAVTGFVMMFKDLGLSMATVQKANINHAQISTLFWINVVLSLGLMLLTAALAPAIAWFYNEPRLTWITLVLAIAFIFGGFTVQHQALLRRQMRFGSLALIQIISLLVGILTAIIAAFYGMDYWSLVLMQLVTAITNVIAVWIACGWRPGMPVRRSGVRKMLAFGGHLTGFYFVNYFARNLDNILIGWRWGSGPLGLYSKAYSLLMLPLQQVNSPLSAVAVPVLSRLQEEPGKFRSYYRKGLTLATMFGMPIVVFLFVTADKAILIVLGEQWTDAARIFRILGIAAFVGTTLGPGSGWVYVALGNVRRQFFVSIVSTGLLVIGFIIGLPWGPIGVATAFSIHALVWRMPSMLICFWRTFMKPTDFLVAIWRPAGASILAGASLFLIDGYFLTNTNLLIRFLSNLVEYSVIYILCWILLPGGRRILFDTLSLVNELKHNKTNTGAKNI
jgi:O-antigen/teichoic acid export membrane protein